MDHKQMNILIVLLYGIGCELAGILLFILFHMILEDASNYLGYLSAFIILVVAIINLFVSFREFKKFKFFKEDRQYV